MKKRVMFGEFVSLTACWVAGFQPDSGLLGTKKRDIYDRAEIRKYSRRRRDLCHVFLSPNMLKDATKKTAD